MQWGRRDFLLGVGRGGFAAAPALPKAFTRSRVKGEQPIVVHGVGHFICKFEFHAHSRLTEEAGIVLGIRRQRKVIDGIDPRAIATQRTDDGVL